jgi:hypothetical protein
MRSHIDVRENYTSFSPVVTMWPFILGLSWLHMDKESRMLPSEVLREGWESAEFVHELATFRDYGHHSGIDWHGMPASFSAGRASGTGKTDTA